MLASRPLPLSSSLHSGLKVRLRETGNGDRRVNNVNNVKSRRHMKLDFTVTPKAPRRKINTFEGVGTGFQTLLVP